MPSQSPHHIRPIDSPALDPEPGGPGVPLGESLSGLGPRSPEGARPLGRANLGSDSGDRALPGSWAAEDRTAEESLPRDERDSAAGEPGERGRRKRRVLVGGAILLGLLGLDRLRADWSGAEGDDVGSAITLVAPAVPPGRDLDAAPTCCEVRDELRKLAALPGISQTPPPPCEGTPDDPHPPGPEARP
jgi:hypothetical protein